LLILQNSKDVGRTETVFAFGEEIKLENTNKGVDMKKFAIAIMMVCMMVFAGAPGVASANTSTFDFNGYIANLDSYMSNLFAGADSVNTTNLSSYNNAIRTSYYSASGTIDFDPCRGGACIRLNSVSFTWKVYDETSGVDFGLDVYNALTGQWVNNVFSVSGVYDGATGNSGLVTFDAAYRVTQLRIHDSGEHDVGIDNLMVNWDNCTSTAVPEPSTMLLLGFGLAGAAYARKRFKK